MPINYKDLLLKEVKELFKKLPPNVRIRVYYDSEEKQNEIMKPTRKKNNNSLTSRVGKLELRVDKLDSRMDKLDSRMNRMESKLDQIGDALFEFIKTTNTRLDNLTNDVNSLKQEVKNINARLDYNGLKKLPESSK